MMLVLVGLYGGMVWRDSKRRKAGLVLRRG
jgi:hypothetical protein